jgi:hypothetical protein
MNIDGSSLFTEMKRGGSVEDNHLLVSSGGLLRSQGTLTVHAPSLNVTINFFI